MKVPLRALLGLLPGFHNGFFERFSRLSTQGLQGVDVSIVAFEIGPSKRRLPSELCSEVVEGSGFMGLCTGVSALCHASPGYISVIYIYIYIYTHLVVRQNSASPHEACSMDRDPPRQEFPDRKDEKTVDLARIAAVRLLSRMLRGRDVSLPARILGILLPSSVLFRAPEILARYLALMCTPGQAKDTSRLELRDSPCISFACRQERFSGSQGAGQPKNSLCGYSCVAFDMRGPRLDFDPGNVPGFPRKDVR